MLHRMQQTVLLATSLLILKSQDSFRAKLHARDTVRSVGVSDRCQPLFFGKLVQKTRNVLSEVTPNYLVYYFLIRKIKLLSTLSKSTFFEKTKSIPTPKSYSRPPVTFCFVPVGDKKRDSMEQCHAL